MPPILKVNDLAVEYPDGFALSPLSFSVESGQTLAVIGESGSGKTTLVRAITDLFSCRWAKVSGEVLLEGENLLTVGEKRLRALRMRRFSVVLQNPSALLNPALSLRDQLCEVLKKELPRNRWAAACNALIERVGLAAADLDRFPRSLSGGMAQRFSIACAIALSPALVVLDEPTSALDPDASAALVALLQQIQQESGCAFLLVTHDLAFAQALSHQTLVLYRGMVEESGPTEQLLNRPRHPYTQGMLSASAEVMPLRDLWGIRPSTVSNATGCPFFGRCTQSVAPCETQVPPLQQIVGESARQLRCHRGGIIVRLAGLNLEKHFARKPVLQHATIEVMGGEVVALIGDSGSGKTTLASIVAGFLLPEQGEVRFEGEKANFSALHKTLGGLQMVFQDSADALNPTFSVGQAVCEAARLAKLSDFNMRGHRALAEVGLPDDPHFWSRQVGQLSGGQAQRLSLARALTMQPRLLVADEPTSMLDPSSKANVLRLLKGLQNQNGFSMLIITHDLAAAVKISDRIYRMHNAKAVELTRKELLSLCRLNQQG